MSHGLQQRATPAVDDAGVVWPDPAWRLVGPAYRDDRCIHDFVEDQVKRRPEAAAIVFGDTELTYGGLNVGRIVWQITCENWVSARRRRSPSASTGRSSWPSLCWRVSSPARLACRSTRNCLANGSPSCSRTPARA